VTRSFADAQICSESIRTPSKSKMTAEITASTSMIVEDAQPSRGPLFIAAGSLHFLRPSSYEAIMPEYLPAHRELVYASGIAEIVGRRGADVRRDEKLGGNGGSQRHSWPCSPQTCTWRPKPDRYRRKRPRRPPALIARLPVSFY